jgi:hypothetical protein
MDGSVAVDDATRRKCIKRDRRRRLPGLSINACPRLHGEGWDHLETLVGSAVGIAVSGKRHAKMLTKKEQLQLSRVSA